MSMFRRPPERNMSRRGRWYLNIGALRHLTVGLFTLLFPAMFANIVYKPLIAYAPLWLWGSLYVITAVLCIYASVTQSAEMARFALVVSATGTLAWGAGSLIGIIDAWTIGTRVTPILAILLLTLAAKDYAVCTQPMNTPFEQLMQRETGVDMEAFITQAHSDNFDADARRQER